MLMNINEKNDAFAPKIANFAIIIPRHVAKPIRMYFNSIGGIRSSGLAVLDTMENCSSELWTYNLGACGQVRIITMAKLAKLTKFAKLAIHFLQNLQIFWRARSRLY